MRQCQACGVRVVKPLGTMPQGSDPSSVALTGRSIGLVVECFPTSGITFAELKSELVKKYHPRYVRDKYLRAHLSRCISEGLVVSETGKDGLARYFPRSPPKDGGAP